MFERLAAVWATAWSTPWRRAPLLLRRRPGVLAAVAGATTVMVASVAAVPLFLSSAGTASVALQVEERCPRDTGVRTASYGTPEEIRAGQPNAYAALDDHLRAPNRWVALELVSLAGADRSRFEQVTLLARDDAADHVEVLDGPAGQGIWITDRAAELTGLAVGDVATVGTTDLPVAVVYRDLAGYTVDRFWCSNAESLLIESRGGDLVLPPPVVLLERGALAAVMTGAGRDGAPMWSESWLADDLTLPEADQLVTELACHGDHAAELSWCEDGRPLVPRRWSNPGDGGIEVADDREFVSRWFRSALPFVTERSDAIQTAVGSGIWPVAGFASLAGAGLVAAAASLWFDRRRREVVLLATRGVSPLGLGVKAVLELVLPLLAGGVVGVAAAYGLVVWLGPSPTLDGGALGRAGVVAAAALAGAALTVLGVVTARVRGHAAGAVRRVHPGLVPWELVLVAAAVVSFQRLGEWGIPVGRGADVTTVDVWGLLFPVLFLLAAVAVVARLLALAVRPLLALSRRWPTPLFLAVRRVARSRSASLGLVAATALGAGVLVYAATMNRSLTTSLDAKATTFVGSDVAARVAGDVEVPAALEGRATKVEVYADAWVEDGGREAVTILGIDPETFADAAFWDGTFAGESLDGIVERLSAPSPSGSIAAVTLGLDADGPTEATIGIGFSKRVTIEDIADVHAFPGVKRGKGTVFVAAGALPDDGMPQPRTELWVAGDHDEIVSVLRGAGVRFEEARVVREVVDGSSFVTVSWTFGFMRSLGLAAGALALGGVAVHLDARRRERVLGHAFLRRMGLTARQHRRALLVELVASVLVGAAVGLAAALTGATLAHGRIDPVPELRPGPLLRIDVPTVAVAAGAAVIVVLAAAALAQRRAEADDAVEVLRAGA